VFAVEKYDIQKANIVQQSANPSSLRIPSHSVHTRQGQDHLQIIILHNLRLFLSPWRVAPGWLATWIQRGVGGKETYGCVAAAPAGCGHTDR